VPKYNLNEASLKVVSITSVRKQNFCQLNKEKKIVSRLFVENHSADWRFIDTTWNETCRPIDFCVDCRRTRQNSVGQMSFGKMVPDQKTWNERKRLTIIRCFLGAMTFSRMTLSITTFSIMTLLLRTFSIKTLSATTFTIMTLDMLYASYTECHK